MLSRKRLVAFAVLLALAGPAAAEPPLHQIDQKSPAQCLAFSDDGKYLAAGCQDGTIVLTEVATGKHVRTIECGAPVAGIAFSHDGKYLATKLTGKMLSTFDVATGKLHKTGGFTNYNANLLAFTPDNTIVVATAYGEFVQWRFTQGGASGTKWGNTQQPGFAAVAPDGKLTAWSTSTGLVQVQENEPRRAGSIQVGAARSMAIGPEGKLFAIGSTDKDKTVHLWDYPTKKKVGELTGLPDAAAALCFSADGNVLAGLTPDGGLVRVWDVSRGRTRRQLTNLRGPVGSMVLSPDGKVLATTGADNKVYLWNVATRELGKGPPVELSDEEMMRLWGNLASSNFDQADAAWRKLAHGGDKAVQFLHKQVMPIAAPPVDMTHVAKLLTDLNDDRYAVRAKASKELLETGDIVIVPLQKLLAKPPSGEAEHRAQLILRKLKDPVLTPDRLRALEAIELLEQVKTAEARRLLEEIAREALVPQLRHESLLALQRMDRAAAEDKEAAPK
jgi:hypothetical protein